MLGENVGEKGTAQSPSDWWLSSSVDGLSLTFGEQLPRIACALFDCSSNRGVAASYIISRHEVPGAFFFSSSFFMTNFLIPPSLDLGTVQAL